MVVIRIKGIKARYSQKTGWKSEQKGLARLLNDFTEHDLDSAMAYIPNWENFVAEAAAREFAGEVLHLNEVESIPGRIY